MSRINARFLCFLGTLLVGLGATPADAFKFGPKGALELRGKVYTQYTVATEQSQEYTQPEINPGDMKQWRTFYSPELEVDFRRLAGFGNWIDELEGRAAVWGFYDGIYDFGPARWHQNLALTRATRNVLGNDAKAAFYSQGRSMAAALENRGQRRDGREFYGRRVRVNEAYVDVAKGPWFMRLGKQAISWGEADTVGLLDANNPFDTLLQPGLYMDLDEARIPLWTLRTTYELFSTWGPFSSGFAEAYWVPGWLDTEIGYLNIQGVSPYSQPPPLQAPGLQVYDLLPEYGLENSRWGIKLQTVVNRDYNLSVWFYRAFNLVPVPTLVGLSAPPESYVTTVLNHDLSNVWGAALSWYSDALNSIVRTELELFEGEASFLAYRGVGRPASRLGQPDFMPGTFEDANILRGELGVDHNFFLPLVNPSSSFLASVSIVFEANLDETDDKDFRTPIIKPSAIERQLAGSPIQAGQNAPPSCDDKNTPGPTEPGLSRCDYVNIDPLEAFMQATVRSDFMFGSLTPQLTTIATFRGALTFAPSVVYRVNDNVLLDAKYINTHTFGSGDNGYTKGVGLNRDRDQIWFRATFQLN